MKLSTCHKTPLKYELMQEFCLQDRQRPLSQMSDVAEDVILQKKKKRGEPWKV